MAPNYGPRIVTDGLVLALDAANPKSYPGSGTIWKDLSGNGNDATLYNSPVFSNGVSSWDGTNQYAQVTANQTSLDFTTEQTVIMMLKHTFTSGRRNPWDQAYGGYGTWTHEQGGYMNGYYGDNGGNAQPYTASNNGTTARGVWNFIARGRDTNSVIWWNNGQRHNTISNPYAQLPVTTNNIRIARGYAGYWEGDIGFILAYNKCLSDAEIKQNFTALRGRYGL